MPAPQFNKKVTTQRWYSLTFQSNVYLNDELQHTAKVEIAKVLKEKFPNIHEMYSYVHCNLVFSMPTNNPVETLNEIIKLLQIPLISKKIPQLLWNVNLVAALTSANENYMYINGDDGQNANFENAIVTFHQNPR